MESTQVKNNVSFLVFCSRVGSIFTRSRNNKPKRVLEIVSNVIPQQPTQITANMISLPPLISSSVPSRSLVCPRMSTSPCLNPYHVTPLTLN